MLSQRRQPLISIKSRRRGRIGALSRWSRSVCPEPLTLLGLGGLANDGKGFLHLGCLLRRILQNKRRHAHCIFHATDFSSRDRCGLGLAARSSHFVAAKRRFAAPLAGTRLVPFNDLRSGRFLWDQGLRPLLLDPRFVCLHSGDAGPRALHGEDSTD